MKKTLTAKRRQLLINAYNYELEGPALLRSLHEDWLKRGAEEPDSDALKKAKAKISLVENEYSNCMRRIERIRKERHEAAENAIKLVGAKQPLKINGKTYIVTSRGGMLYYRLAGEVKGI